MVSDKSPANKISVNSAEQDDRIDSVTVFRANHAEVKRRVQLELKQGQNHVAIERLPSCIREDSVRVDGIGAAVIFDVLYHRPVFASTSDDEATIESRRVLEALRKERDVARDESNFLNVYGKTLDSKNIGIEDMQRFLDMFAPRQIAVAKRIQELDTKVDEAEKVYNQARSKVYADAQGAKRGTKITVTVLSETDGPAELLLTYVVSNASWTPLYDLRASIAKSPDAPSTVKLHYRASITQNTGEDWPEVALTLSTASPQLGSSVPKLSAWRIGFPTPPRPKIVHVAAAMEEEKEESDDDMGFGLFDDGPADFQAAAPAASMAVRHAVITDQGVLSATFGISGRSNIPSDQGSHKVVITVLDYNAELEWVCVPREKESVFLRCKVVNASDFTLLPGEASVFVDDNFVSKSSIQHVSPNDSFETSLGVDSALRVSYPPIRTVKRTTTQSGFAFLGKDTRQTITSNSQRINARNTRLSPITLRVFDHVPVSTDALLKVDVSMPDGLGAIFGAREPGEERPEEDKKRDRPWTTVFKGTKARWANLDVGGEGMVEWLCEIGAGDEIELDLEWEISAPVGKAWRDAK